jgi:hypothetical protein
VGAVRLRSRSGQEQGSVDEVVETLSAACAPPR